MSCRRRVAMITCLLSLGLAGGYPMAAQAAPSGAVAMVTRALTGQSDVAALAPRPVCPPAAAGQATCAAQALVDQVGEAYVHPLVQPSASPVRFFPTARGTPSADTFAPAGAGAGQPQPGTPAYLQQAYDLSYLSQTQGAGDTVAIVDAYDDPSAESDLATYRAQFGLPACTTANGCFSKVNQSGQQGSYPASDSDWATEISLDLDSVSALCPRCHIVLVEANSAYTSDLQTAQATADALGAQQISDSWGAPASSSPGGSFSFTGVATVAAAGDSGYLGPSQNQYPAALAGVTAAGGTTLTAASGGRGFTETAWAGAGSGCDDTQTKPSWQTDAGCTGRSYDDLSADANPDTGLLIYDSGQGGWLVVGGTSEATPLIAAYYAVTGAQAQTPAWAYQHTGQLNDPASGSNGSCLPTLTYICNAQPGYDGPTGAGSISGSVVSGGPGIGGPGPGNTYTAAVSASGAQLAGGIYPNGSDTTWFVQYGTSTGYGQQTAPVDVGSGTAPVPVSAALSGLTAGTQYHYRLVAQNGYGTTYGYDFTLTTSPPPAPTITGTAASVTGQTATLTASLNPQGAPTTYRFQYGTTIALGQSSAPQTISGATPADISAVASGLSPRTTYFYQLFATSAGGAVASPILSFTTGAAPTPPSAHAASAGGRSVAIGSATLTGGRATVVVACQTAAACHLRIRVTVSGQVVATATVTVRGHSKRTVRLRLSGRNAALARAHRTSARAVLLELRRGAYRTVGSRRLG